MTRPHVYLFGWPSHVGGADTRVAHTLPLWCEIADVTVIPNDVARLGEHDWVQRLEAAGAKVARFAELPARLEGFALALSNQRFFVDRIAQRARERGLRVIWSGEMMWHHEGELAALRAGVVEHVLYTSSFQRDALEPAHLAAAPAIRRTVIENYVDPEAFPRLERAAGNAFTIGRLSRADPLKYAEDFPLFHEMLGLARPRYRVMAWSAELAHKYRWHRFGPEWELLTEGAETAASFLSSLDAFVYTLGHDFRESWGRSTVEAMLTGLPVVVPKGHHFASLVQHAETGFLCHDFPSYREACRALEAEPGLRREIGATAARFAREVLCERSRHVAAWRTVFDG